MKLISVEHAGRASFGAIARGAGADDGDAAVVDLGARLSRYADLRALLAADAAGDGALARARALVEQAAGDPASTDHALADLTLARPSTR